MLEQLVVMPVAIPVDGRCTQQRQEHPHRVFELGIGIAHHKHHTQIGPHTILEYGVQILRRGNWCCRRATGRICNMLAN